MPRDPREQAREKKRAITAAQITEDWIADVVSAYLYPKAETIAFYAMTFVLGAISSAWVSIPETTITLLLFMGFDMFTGLMVGARREELNRARSFAGIMKRFATLLVVWMAYLIGYQLGAGDKVGVAVAVMFTTDEGISILENCRKLGVRVPNILLDNLLRLRGRDSSLTPPDDTANGSPLP